MAFQLTLPTLLGVIIGGVAFVFCLAVAMVVLTLRIKHRRQLARTNAAGERRLSRYPGGHLSITDEDVAQMPGTRAAIRDALYSRYTRASAFELLASHENGEKEASKNMILTTPKTGMDISHGTIAAREPVPITASPTKPWPLPRRLTRANRPPTMDFHQTPSAPAANGTKLPYHSMTKKKSTETLKLTPRKEGLKSQSHPLLYAGQGILHVSPEKSAVRSSSLRPKPLFHQKSRSISHGTVLDINNRKRSGSAQLACDLRQPCANFLQAGLPRSISLTSQEPGKVPTGPIPPLPAEALVIRRQRSRKASNSRQSLIISNSKQNSDGTSWNDTSPIKSASQTPVKVSQRFGDQLLKDQSIAGGQMLRPPVSPGVARSATLKAPVDSRKSFQASTQDSITRSNSSGLSESLLNHGWSRSASNASIVKDAARARSKTPVGRSVGAHISVFDFGLPFRSDADIGALSQLDSDDRQKNRRSASILQVISGNERSPESGSKEERPISIATEIPLRWSADIAKRMSMNEERLKSLGKSRHMSRRSSIKQQYTPTSRSPRASTSVPRSKLSLTTPASEPQSLRRPRVDPPAFRPPSKLTFDPQLTQMPENKGTAVRTDPNPDPYFNNALTILPGRDDSDSSTGSLPSTPTRRPSQKRQPSGHHPNRQRAIFDGSRKIVQWPLTRQNSAYSRNLPATIDKSTEKSSNIFYLDAYFNSAIDTSSSEPATVMDEEIPVAPSHRPPSLLYRFPSPPSPPLRKASGSSRGDVLNNPNRLQSYSQPNIQKQSLDKPNSPLHDGVRSKTSANLSNYNSENHRDELVLADSPSNQLRQSVLALRRMNSEISEPSKAGREHRRYLSLGGREEAIAEDRDGGDRGIGVQKLESTANVNPISDASAPPSLASTNAKSGGPVARRQNGGKTAVRGPRAMPGWLDESMMV